MKMPTSRLIGTFSKTVKTVKKGVRSSKAYELLHTQAREEIIPSDVPKGHLAVYVGEERKRFIIRVSFLEHPLFLDLLDQAQQEYGFSPSSRLCIPCSEQLFHSVLCSIVAQKHGNLCPCFSDCYR